jgi:murein L,D-transpeptidase YafK
LFAAHPHAPRGLAVLVLLLSFLTAGTALAEYEDIAYPPARYGPEMPLQEIIQAAGLTLDPDQHIPSPRVEIDKSTYQLRLFSADSLLKTYRIQLGKNAHGAKTRRYDGRTPVGSYRICAHNKWSRYYLSLQLDYPNEADIARALKEKRITQGQAASLQAARAAGGCPGGRTRLGGEVFIHGQLPRITREVLHSKRKHPPSRPDLQPGDLDPGWMREFYNWTLGCIALANPDIRELYRYLPDGTPVEIREASSRVGSAGGPARR